MVESRELGRLRLQRDGSVTWIWLARPDVHNAFDAQLMDELRDVFALLQDDAQTRVVVLAGEGRSFSAGADVNWMRDSAAYSRGENVDDSMRLANMLEAIAESSKPVVCRVHGLAIGGALGLVCASDYVVTAANTQFAFSEVKLGLVPAVISPYVLARIGAGHARALFVTGERFNAQRALISGLVHEIVDEDELDTEVRRVCDEMLTSAPEAIGVIKRLVRDITFKSSRDALTQTVETIATKRTDPEGQEGLSAFLDRRKPNWMDDAHEPAWLRKK